MLCGDYKLLNWSVCAAAGGGTLARLLIPMLRSMSSSVVHVHEQGECPALAGSRVKPSVACVPLGNCFPHQINSGVYTAYADLTPPCRNISLITPPSTPTPTTRQNDSNARATPCMRFQARTTSREVIFAYAQLSGHNRLNVFNADLSPKRCRAGGDRDSGRGRDRGGGGGGGGGGGEGRLYT